MFGYHTSSGERNILFLVCLVTSLLVTFDFLGDFTYKQLHFQTIAGLFSRTNFPAQVELFFQGIMKENKHAISKN